MSSLGQVRIGHKAPYFEGEAVIQGIIKEVNINTYIHPTIQGEEPDPNAAWLILLFIPAAFSFVCPTEVLAFQNCLDEFKDRNCSVVFVSVDTKHSLWHWQNVPRQYGGLGKIDIPLLSDANHHIARDYGVLIEEEGVSLRGMFILDGEGIVQQVTLNNLTVGRSVLEALRLLEAFQAVAKHGVLCPVDWKPTSDAAETLNTISNTLTESYEERLANLQKEFGETPITDLDAKHSGKNSTHSSSENINESTGRGHLGSSNTPTTDTVSTPTPDSPPATIQEVTCTRGMQRSQSSGPPPSTQRHGPSPKASSPSLTRSSSAHTANSSSAPPRTTSPPLLTPTPTHTTSPQRPSLAVTAGIVRSHAAASHTSSGTSRPDSHTSHTSASQTYESRRGSHVVLEFADPTSSPQTAFTAARKSASDANLPGNLRTHSLFQLQVGHARANSAERLDGGRTHSEPPTPLPWSVPSTPGAQTRLQATFGTIKKMGAGLVSPRRDLAPRKAMGAVGASAQTKDPGYFDVKTDDGVEA